MTPRPLLPSRAMRRRLVRLRRIWRGACADTLGIAAVEFALVLPLMLTLYLGSAELTQGVMASRKMTLVSRTISDLVAQQASGTNMTDTTMSSVFSAATAIMSPFDVSTLNMTVSAVDFVANGGTGGTIYNGYEAKVRWSKTGPYGGTARSCAKLTPVANSSSPSRRPCRRGSSLRARSSSPTSATPTTRASGARCWPGARRSR